MNGLEIQVLYIYVCVCAFFIIDIDGSYLCA